MFVLLNPGIILVVFAAVIFVFCIVMAVKTNNIQKAVERFTEMAKGKSYDEVVAVMGKPQSELEKTCPNTGDQIKVSTWEGGFYHWEQCRYKIVAVFDENGVFNNVKMYKD